MPLAYPASDERRSHALAGLDAAVGVGAVSPVRRAPDRVAN